MESCQARLTHKEESRFARSIGRDSNVSSHRVNLHAKKLMVASAESNKRNNGAHVMDDELGFSLQSSIQDDRAVSRSSQHTEYDSILAKQQRASTQRQKSSSKANNNRDKVMLPNKVNATVKPTNWTGRAGTNGSRLNN